MSFESDGKPKFELLGDAGISEMFYPTPKERKTDAVEAELKSGDMVEILVGPAAGKVGLVVVDNNSNYHDYLDYAGTNAIGVNVIQVMDQGSPLVAALLSSGLVPTDAHLESATRWFDTPDQLQLVYRDEPVAEND